MATFAEAEVPIQRYDVMVERWGFTAIKLSVPAFSQQDAINRIVGEANGRYYCFIKAYAPERGGGRNEDVGNNVSSISLNYLIKSSKGSRKSNRMDTTIFHQGAS